MTNENSFNVAMQIHMFCPSALTDGLAPACPGVKENSIGTLSRVRAATIFVHANRIQNIGSARALVHKDMGHSVRQPTGRVGSFDLVGVACSVSAVESASRTEFRLPRLTHET
eukprot:COSAG02_NODE_20611_length_823_cov_0.828729_2_plen_113_part_00